MKKLILTIAIVISFLNISFAQRYDAKDFVYVGVEHNRLLEVSYNAIVSNKMTKSSKGDLITILQESVKQQKGYSDADLELGLKNLAEISAIPYSIEENFHSCPNFNEIGTNAVTYFDELHKVVMTEKITSKELTAAVEKLEAAIYNDRKIDNKSLLIFFSASNVAKYSTMYWEQNSTKWENIEPSIEGRGGRRVAGADVAGAIGGAVTCWMANMVPGAGQIAYGGAIACGAVGASICAAADLLMNHWGW